MLRTLVLCARCWERLKAKGEQGKKVRWRHRLNRHELEQSLGDSGGQESLSCYSPRGGKESDTP